LHLKTGIQHWYNFMCGDCSVENRAIGYHMYHLHASYGNDLQGSSKQVRWSEASPQEAIYTSNLSTVQMHQKQKPRRSAENSQQQQRHIWQLCKNQQLKTARPWLSNNRIFKNRSACSIHHNVAHPCHLKMVQFQRHATSLHEFQGQYEATSTGTEISTSPWYDVPESLPNARKVTKHHSDINSSCRRPNKVRRSQETA